MAKLHPKFPVEAKAFQIATEFYFRPRVRHTGPAYAQKDGIISMLLRTILQAVCYFSQ